jgi:ABC-type transporter Mla maintaining outer membrane lipid asymmetry ATPase subunit MlaF
VTPAALAIAGLTKDYRGLRPLRIQQLTVGAEETVAILGLDQASAEVFVNLVTGATLPDNGSVHVFGLDTSSIADGIAWLQTLDRFGIVTERAVLLDQLTVIQNLAIPFTLEVEPPSAEVRHAAETIAREIGLPEASWTAAIATLDADGRARVRLGRALAANPSLLLLEHVSAGLPRPAATQLGGDIRRIAAARRIAALAATADEPFARSVAGRVLKLEAASGRLVEHRRGWFG